MTSPTDSPERVTAEVLAAAPHGFFTRRGGVSGGLYASLNCGPGSRDADEAVAANRARVAAAMGVAPDRLLTLHQVHSARVVVAEGPWTGPRPEADGVVTRDPGLAVAALAADCAPVLFADVEAGVVGAAHAGWRGALSGVIGATVEAMLTLGARRARIAAAVGPCIGQASYEVGPEFVEGFIDEDRAFARFFARGDGDRALFDLPGFCLDRLAAEGIERRAFTGGDTCAEPERFFSHRRMVRRGEADYGRMISAIRLSVGSQM